MITFKVGDILSVSSVLFQVVAMENAGKDAVESD